MSVYENIDAIAEEHELVAIYDVDENENEVVALGVTEDREAGIFQFEATPFFANLQELDDYCSELRAVQKNPSNEKEEN
jgi:hypothetical protein